MSPLLECAACGKTYSSPRFLTDHERNGCATSKRALSKILETSKTLWEARKRRRIEDTSLTERSDAVIQSISGGPSTPVGSKRLGTHEPIDDPQLPGPSSGADTTGFSRTGKAPANPGSRRTGSIRFFDEPPALYAPLPQPEVDHSSQVEKYNAHVMVSSLHLIVVTEIH
ncbi:hypothetical protein BKA70DRAFT_1422611 [Coprinopsis sp. MPI-PUGE-AT-0042]|nr:hypothetical protein BKA70DRAFT_1422611 [Coprinopsis sp. MPI-PUGE-AT-0042]